MDAGAVRDVPDIAAEDRWPEYRARALELGIESSLSIPLVADGRTLGGLNLYGTGPHAFAGVVRQHVEIRTAAGGGARVRALTPRLAARWRSP